MRDLLTDKETAKILGKRIDTLYKTIDFFDRFDDDEWELFEGEHFEFVAKNSEYRDRRFTEEGVEALARYYEKDLPGILDFAIEALTHRRRRRQQRLVSRRITQELIEAGGLVEVRGELAFVNRRTSIGILQTNGKGLNNCIDRLGKAGSLDGQEGLEIEKHFLLTENSEAIWSQKGLASISIDMIQNSRLNKSRRAWVEAVGEVVEDCFKAEIKRLSAAPLRIDQAIAKAKRAASDTCQVTGVKKARGRKLELDGHHLFDKATRPDLADLHENILILESSIHSEFHSWIGGRGCIPSDFLDFVSSVRGDLFDSVNSRAAERHSRLVSKLVKLERNYEGTQLRYR
jgi:hypothetical protein